MSPLRRRMIEDMRLRNFSACTERSYVHYVADFALHFKTSPEYLGLDDIRGCQVYLTEKRQLSASSINTFVSAVQFLYTVTLEMPWGNNRFVRMKVPEKLPVVLSQTEVTALFHHVGILKHRAVLMLCYGSGLRISEAVSLKAEHIDSDRMLIRVENGKGAKDRYTVLSQALLNLLRRYWKIQQPKDYLFPGSEPGTHIQPGTIQEICRDACRMAGIEKRVTPHTLRHSFATHLLDQKRRSMAGLIRIRLTMLLRLWSTEPTRAPFRCCSATAASTPPPGIPPLRRAPCPPSSARSIGVRRNRRALKKRRRSGPSARPRRRQNRTKPPANSDMPRPAFEVADIFRTHGARYREQHALPFHQIRLMYDIESCRTAALGGNREKCGHCAEERISYNSCCNRHCPKCQNLSRTKWVECRKGELLPIEYHHVVFTIPEQLNDLVLRNKPRLYKILFAASAATLQTIAADPRHLGAQIGFFSVLHSWGQNLLFHPHIHCVATGGGISLDGTRWVSSRPGFFLPVRVLSSLFRRLFLEALEDAFRENLLCFPGKIEGLEQPSAFFALTASLRRIDWVVYSKPPFGGPQRVLEYLGRYTHRVAIDNRRILNVGDGNVTFQFKQYRSADAHKSRTMTVSADEFIRRFLLHSLPPRVPRIRHYGLFAGRTKKRNLARCRELLEVPVESLLPSAAQIQAAIVPVPDTFRRCPACLIGIMVRIARSAPLRQNSS